MKKPILSGLVTLFLLISLPLAAETLDLLLFNVWSGLDRGGFITAPSLEEPGNREFRRELLERGIEALAPDIVGLLELNPLPKAAEELAEMFDFSQIHQITRGGVRVGPVGLPANLRQGMALLTREELELTRQGLRKISGAPLGGWYQLGEAGVVLAGTVEIGSRTVHLYLTHWEESLYDSETDLAALVARYEAGELESDELVARIRAAAEGSELRRKQAAATLDFINQTAGKEPVILMGTLAAAPGDASMAFVREAGFRDSWSGRGGATWDEEGNPNTRHGKDDLYRAGQAADRVDYVLIRGEGIRSLGSRIVFNEPTYGTWPSDHYGLSVRLEIDEE